MTIYIERLKKKKIMKISPKNDSCKGSLMILWLNHYFQNRGGEEKVNSGICPFCVQKLHKLVGGQPNYMSFR
jgi:hypothetical protein